MKQWQIVAIITSTLEGIRRHRGTAGFCLYSQLKAILVHRRLSLADFKFGWNGFKRSAQARAYSIIYLPGGDMKIML